MANKKEKPLYEGTNDTNKKTLEAIKNGDAAQTNTNVDDKAVSDELTTADLTEQNTTNPQNKVDAFLNKNGVALDTPNPVEKRHLDIIGIQQIKKATITLKKYMEQRTAFDERVKENEEWWKLRHWSLMHGKDGTARDDIEPTSAWLFNSIMNKLADFNDNYPEPNIRARTAEDSTEADHIKAVIPMTLERNDFEDIYNEVVLSKLKNGTGILGVYWDSTKDGIGDVLIRNVDVLSLYWQPGVENIQDSRNVFHIELVDTEALQEQYPEFADDINSVKDVYKAKYTYEDNIDTTDKSLVIDWYYKRFGKLHYCKYVGDVLLYASENEPDDYPNGWYNDGNYPFIIDTLFKMEGTVAGFGYIDVCKSPQLYIDLMDKAIVTNALMQMRPRYFTREDASFNEDDLLDWDKPFVKTDSSLGTDDLRKIEIDGLNSYAYNARDSKINELKETSGNRDVSTGGTANGVTAASAISALIETGSKGSRLAIKGTYRAHRKMVYLIIERYRQFYDMPRYVRIIGDDGTEQFYQYDNSHLQAQIKTNAFGEEYQYLPEFDIEVSAQKASPYSKMSQNELALQFYGNNFFNPQNTDQTLACLTMMDFDHKAEMIKQIQQNGTMLDAIGQLQEENQKLKVMADLAYGSNLTGNNAPAAANTQQKEQKPVSAEAIDAINAATPEGNSMAVQAKKQAATAATPR